ncbi:hypothetical protein NQZ68_035608 [Dissostichus eleginoides]|nr:hypothetical protein NQZ68_035608 [Dissostichus eleginoides]
MINLDQRKPMEKLINKEVEEVSEEDKVAEEGEISKGVIDQQEKVSRMKDASYVVSSHIGSEIVRNTGCYKYQNIAPHSNKHQTTALHTFTPGEVSMTTIEAGVSGMSKRNRISKH